MALLDRARRFLLELRAPPTPAAAEAAHARAYADPRWLEPYARREYVLSGLTDAERDLLPLLRGHLLDVGCGTGREALGFAREGRRVTAIDACEAAIQVANQYATADVTFATGSVHNLSFAPRTFDAAFLSSDVYGGIPGRANRVATLEALARVVRPGGLVVFPVTLASPPRLLRRAFGAFRRCEPGDRFAPGPAGPLYKHAFWDVATLQREVAAAGLAFERDGPWVLARRAPDAGPDGRRYKHHPEVLCEASGTELILLHARRGTTFHLNGTGRAIWSLAGEGLTSVEVAKRLRPTFHVEEARLEADARELLAELARSDLLVPS